MRRMTFATESRSHRGIALDAAPHSGGHPCKPRETNDWVKSYESLVSRGLHGDTRPALQAARVERDVSVSLWLCGNLN
jgi:hypothetical protein